MEIPKEVYLWGTICGLRHSQEQDSNESYPSTVVDGRMYMIDKDVFPSHYFTDTKFFTEHMPSQKGKSFLEIGCGAGITAITAALQGAERVVATDISMKALENTFINAKMMNIRDKIEIRPGSIYGPLDKEERFDTVYWNMPFCYVDFQPKGIETGVFSYKYHNVREFFNGARNHLTQKGKLMFGFSPTIGRPELIRQYLDENHLRERCIAEQGFPAGTLSPAGPVTLQLYEAKEK